MTDDWSSYLCNVNDQPASIFLNLGLRGQAPMPDKSWLLWVWVYFQNPRPDGLSDRNEAPRLFEIEDRLDVQVGPACNAILAGRITTRGRREFYYYGERSEPFQRCVADTLRQFSDYQFDCGSQKEPAWNQYLNVLYPSEEDLQKIKNRRVLDVLEREGDIHTIEREVTHWVYFANNADRKRFLTAIRALGYSQRQLLGGDSPRNIGLTFFRTQAVTADLIDAAVIELLRLAQEHRADYDGWETSVEKD